jgi:hypothetical protein
MADFEKDMKQYLGYLVLPFLIRKNLNMLYPA